MENPPNKYFRLKPNGEVRLRYAYLLTCKDVVKNEKGEIVKIIGVIDRASRGGNAPDGRKVKGTIHWVDASNCVKADAMIYDKLFTKADMGDLAEGEDFKDYLNPQSLVKKTMYAEPSVKELKPGIPVQFERVAYFMADSKSFKDGVLAFNRTVTLKDSFSKAAAK